MSNPENISGRKAEVVAFSVKGLQIEPGFQRKALKAVSQAMNLLIIDDELNIRKTLSLFFESEGRTVFAVSNPDDVLTGASRRSFDLALLDLRLGRSSGLDLIPKLLATSPWLKMAVITAYASIDTAAEAIKRGAAEPKEVLAVLRERERMRP